MLVGKTAPVLLPFTLARRSQFRLECGGISVPGERSALAVSPGVDAEYKVTDDDIGGGAVGDVTGLFELCIVRRKIRMVTLPGFDAGT